MSPLIQRIDGRRHPQAEHKGAVMVGEVTAVGPGQASGDREPEPGPALAVKADKALKSLLRHALGQSRPVIEDPDFHELVGSSERHVDPGGGVAPCVVQQVGDDLLTAAASSSGLAGNGAGIPTSMTRLGDIAVTLAASSSQSVSRSHGFRRTL